jgi:hypothetical protein
MHLRAGIAAAAAALLLLLLGPAVARADHTLSVNKAEAAAGDEVEFQITGTKAGESYIIKVDDREVASGVDSAGNGVTDKFKMPDFGNSNQAVSVEVRISVPNEADHLGSLSPPLRYVTAFAGATPQQPAPQPAPATTVPATVSDPGPGTSTTPRPSRPSRPRTEGGGGGGNNNSNRGESNSNSPPSNGGGSSTSSGSSSTPSSSTPSSTSTSDSSGASPVSGSSGPEVPGPSGPSAAPVGTSIASALKPISGLVQPGKTGFPILLILLIVLLGATIVTATGPRLWQRWEPSLPWGPQVDDDVRLGALSRASASGAELQQTIAERRATRSAGRVLPKNL